MINSKGFTLVELLIVVAVGGITLAIVAGAMTGKSIIPSKESCLSQGGKWTEGIQYGRYTQLCTYD